MATVVVGTADTARDNRDLFALLPADVAAHVLKCAGGPAGLQATRSTSKAWKATLDSMVTKASCINVPHSCSSVRACAVLAGMPKLHTVDLSSCCQPQLPGSLAKLLLELSKLPTLKALQLSTWSLAQDQGVCFAAAAGQQQGSTSCGPSTGGSSESVQALLQGVTPALALTVLWQNIPTIAAPAPTAPATAAPSAAAVPHPHYDIVLPAEVARITNLQELIISPCPEVSMPSAKRLELPASLLRMQHLTRLKLHSFLPAVHHLRGLKHLRHLAISVPQSWADAGNGATATGSVDAAGAGRLQQCEDAINAAKAAVQSIAGLTTLHVHLSARQFGHLLDPTSIVMGVVAGDLLEVLSTSRISVLPVSPVEALGFPSESSHNSWQALAGSSAGASSSALSAAVSARPATFGAAGSNMAAPAGPSLLSLADILDPNARFGRAICTLQELKLTYTGGLYHLPNKFAAANMSLRDLDLSCSRLTVEAAAVLGGLTNLTSLCLSESRLREMPATWSQLTNLLVLDVSGNPLGSLPPFFSCLQSLHKLMVAGAHMLLLPAFVGSLTNLEHLNVASNKLQELPVELCSCTGLMHLDVSKNRLQTLPDHFSALSRMTQLSLTGNHLDALPSGLHGLRCLSHLGLALNYYKVWKHAVPCFAALVNTLQELELQHTATVLDDAAGFLAVIGQLTALTSLAAGSNQLSDLPEAWQHLKQLKVLQLSHNAMEVMPLGLLSLPALTYLDLSYNRLTALPFWIGSSKMQQLKRLNLAKNHLTTLPAEMSGLSCLTQLQLQGNNLASVPPCLCALHCLRVLNIGGNYKLKEGGLGQQLAGLGSLRDVVLPYRLDKAAGELQAAGKAVMLD